MMGKSLRAGKGRLTGDAGEPVHVGFARILPKGGLAEEYPFTAPGWWALAVSHGFITLGPWPDAN